jgi:hypothetical protein
MFTVHSTSVATRLLIKYKFKNKVLLILHPSEWESVCHILIMDSPHQYYSGEQIKKIGMGGVFRMHGDLEGCVQGLYGES